jgi:Ca2+-binding RTX toxin-like protein
MTNILIGTKSDDILQGTSGDDFIFAGAGNDTIWGNGGNNVLQLTGLVTDYAINLNSNGSYTIADLRPGSPDGMDTFRDISLLQMGNGVTISPASMLAAAPRFVVGSDGDDKQLGSAGNDAFLGTAGNDSIWGGTAGNDSISYNAASTDFAYVANANGSFTLVDMRNGAPLGVDMLRSIESIRFTDVTLSAQDLATSLPRYVSGSLSGDNQVGSSGNDVFGSSAGNDRIWGGAGGVDRLLLSGNLADYKVTRASDGLFTLTDLRAANSEGVDAVRAIDTFVFADKTLSEAELSARAAAAQPNVLSGTSSNNVLLGTGQDDVLTGGAGNDRVWGGASGNDTAMYSGKFSDYIITDNDNGSLTIVDKRANGDGTDVVRDVETFRFADKSVTAANIVTAASTYGQVIAGSGEGEFMTAAFMQQLFGAHTSDIMAGSGGNDILRSGPGHDLVVGDSLNGVVATQTLNGISAKQQVGPATAAPGMLAYTASEAMTVKVTFNGETAGFQNALGVYRIAADGTISAADILFPNASLAGSGGSLTANVSNDTFNVQAGEQFGFFIMPNAYGQTATRALLENPSTVFKLVNADGSPANAFGGREVFLAAVNANGTTTLIKSQYGSSLFQSIDAMGNSGLNGDFFAHTSNALQFADGSFRMGFEDLWGGGDKDFDDTVFTVSSSTQQALSLQQIGAPATSAGHDMLYGGAGNDTLLGQAGNDTLEGSTGADTIDGGTGFDTADFSRATSAVTVDLTNGGTRGEAQGDRYFSIEQVIGSSYNDVLLGSAGADVLDGRAGNDLIKGRDGNDTLRGGLGNDTLDGGAGFDTASYFDSTNGVVLSLLTALGTGGDAAGDSFISIERVQGSNTGADNLTGSNTYDVLEGHGGNDQLFGLVGNDYLHGGDGDDVLNGGAGNDTLVGGNGFDTATFNGLQSAYTIAANADGSLTVTGAEGVDLLTGVERLVFNDFEYLV